MLSIIAVVINNLEVTQRFISSIKQYTIEKYELILIDNGSTIKKAINYFKRVANIYFRFDKKIDLAKAWNKGISLSKGNYIAVVNNDIVVPPNWFEPLKEVFDTHNKAGMVSPITYWLIRDVYFLHKELKNFDKTFSKPFKLIKFKEVVWGEFCLFKKQALKDVGGYCELYRKASGENLEICFQLYSKGYEIYVDQRIFVYHQGKASQIPEIIVKEERDKIYRENFELFKSRWPKYTKDWK